LPGFARPLERQFYAMAFAMGPVIVRLSRKQILRLLAAAIYKA
jgi:hypothetical protein